jgi:hypothetical protein
VSQKRIVRRLNKTKEKLTMDTNTSVGSTFQGIAVQVDAGMGYVKCRFVNCQLVFAGMGTKVHLENCIFENSPFAFAGPAANTLNFLTQMYAAGNKEMVEMIFQSIRNGATQIAMSRSAPAAPGTAGPIQ